MKHIIIFSSLCVLVGCTSTIFNAKTVNEETPTLSLSNMTPLLQCTANNIIHAYQSKGAYNPQSNPNGVKKILVVVDEDQFTDGTVRKEASNDGPLADNNQAQMKAIINRWIPSQIVTLPTREIPLLRRNGIKGSSITPFGTLDPNGYVALSRQYAVDNMVYFSGSFTKLDNETPQLDSGYGTHLKNDGDIGTAFSFGDAEQESVVGLSASVGHIGTNTEIGSTLIEARMHKSSGEIKFSIVPGDTNVALSKKVILAEGVQSTQQMLLETAALWLLGMAYPNEAQITHCLGSDSDPAQVIQQQETWGKLKPKEKIQRIQQLLVEQGYLKAGYENGVVDIKTEQAIRAYETAHDLFHTPHTDHNFDHLYLYLNAQR